MLVTSMIAIAIGTTAVAAELSELRPKMGEFIGINGHTVLFKPELYSKVCRKVRDYHSLEWDVGAETNFATRFPFARNGVDWSKVYGSWKDAGFETDVCVMFNNTPPDSWKDLPVDAQTYGTALAKSLGPSSKLNLITSVEIGNEPGKYSDERYREVFRSMATGLRAGDPKLKIATCNITTGKSGDYEKSVACIDGLNDLYDVLNIHTYAIAEGWPSWRRSYPEDPKIEFLKSVEKLIAWRNEHAAGKEIWVTEFGWDASTKPLKTEGDAAQWRGNVSDRQQAQYLVRSFLVFAAMDIDRAYLYFFNDDNEPSFHAASGVTRGFEPKASFHALVHLYRTLGAYRFERVVQKDEKCYAYQFSQAEIPTNKIIAAWSPSGDGRETEVALPLADMQAVRAEMMPLTGDEAPRAVFSVKDGSVKLKVGESPTYVWLSN
jgi:hypothetical protein